MLIQIFSILVLIFEVRQKEFVTLQHHHVGVSPTKMFFEPVNKQLVYQKFQIL